MTRRRGAKMLWVVLQTALWAVVLAFLALLAVPRVSHFDIMIVRSGSMEPKIQTGGIVLVDRNARTLAVGDVGSFRDNGEVITHRVVAMRSGDYVTRGDANNADDQALRKPADVVGKEFFTVPYLGFVLYVLERPFVFVLLLGATGGYLVMSELAVIWREIKKMRGSHEEAAP